MPENLIWFAWSLALLVIWSLVFVLYKKARKRMLWASLITMPFGLTEPLFVPAYWHPPSLIKIIGIPIEELIFAFTFGMLWSSYYEQLTWRTIKS